MLMHWKRSTSFFSRVYVRVCVRARLHCKCEFHSHYRIGSISMEISMVLLFQEHQLSSVLPHIFTALVTKRARSIWATIFPAR